MNLFFLHGFLGQSSDWHQFSNKFQNAHCFFEEIKPLLNSPSPFWDWAENFYKNKRDKENQKNILIGYSLGGRLAMHAVLAKESFWQGAIIVAANPGLLSKEDQQNRWHSDQKWIQRFQNEPWEGVMKDWNQQKVFDHSQNMPSKQNLMPHEVPLLREQATTLMKNFSLGKQENLQHKLRHIKTPILWITGENDKKFTCLAREICDENQNFSHAVVPHAGHRVPWDNPSQFVHLTNKFISSI